MLFGTEFVTSRIRDKIIFPDDGIPSHAEMVAKWLLFYLEVLSCLSVKKHDTSNCQACQSQKNMDDELKRSLAPGFGFMISSVSFTHREDDLNLQIGIYYSFPRSLHVYRFTIDSGQLLRH